MKNLKFLFLLIGITIYAQDVDIITIDPIVNPIKNIIIDLNEDGESDIVVLSAFGKLIWYENMGNNVFAKIILSEPPSNTLPISLAIEDIDNDGDLDLLTTSTILDGLEINSVQLYSNDGNENFTKSIIAGNMTIDSEDNLGVAITIEARHLNDDIYADFIISQSDIGISAKVFLGSENGYTYQNIPNLSNHDKNRLGVVRDLDNDGDIDFVIASDASNNSVSWYDNNGAGIFTHINSVTTSAGVFDAEIADLDGDGDLDILATVVTEGVELFINNGDNTFDEGTLIIASDYSIPSQLIYDIDILDYDNDSDIDFVLATSRWGDLGNENMRIYSNDGNGNFSIIQYAAFDNVNFILDIDTADIDNSNTIDYVVSALNTFPAGDNTGLYLVLGNQILNVDNEVQLPFTISPNPFSEIITINSQTPIEKMDIYSINGSLVYSDVNLLPNTKIDLTFLQSGIYFMHIDTIKIIKLVRK